MVLCYGNDGQVVLRYSYQLESELRISSGDTIVAQLCGECCAQVKSDRKYIKNMYRIQLVLATGLLFLSNHLLSSLYTRPVSRAYRNAPSTLDRDTAVTKRIRISLSCQIYSLALMSNRIPANELDELSSALEDGIDSEDDDEDNDNNNNNEDDDCKEIEDDYTTIFDRSKIEKARELVIDCAELDDSSPPRKDFEDMTEEELQEIYDLALGDSHAEELSRKVEAAMEADWDMQAGVNINYDNTEVFPSGVVDDTESIKDRMLGNVDGGRIGKAIRSAVSPTLQRGSKSGFRRTSAPIKANLDLWSYYAKNEFRRGNFTGAESFYQRCIDYDPKDGRAWLGLARIYYKRGNVGAAERTYKDGLYHSPKNPFLLQGWAVMLEKLGNLAEAQKLLLQSVKSNPWHAASWVALGSINERSGEIGSARYCYSSAVEGDSKSYVALQAWGNLEASSGNHEEARKLFNKAVKASNGKSSHAYHAWAVMERKLGRLDEAELLLGEALLSWPKNTLIRLGFAEIAEKRGRGSKEITEIFEAGRQYAEECGDAGFFQAWAMYELRQLKQLIYERKKFMKQYESMQLEKEKTTEADILEDEEVLSSLFGDDGEFNNEDTSMYFDDHIMNDIKVISNTNVNASPERKVLDVVSNMEPSNDSLFAQKLALFDKRIAEISGEIRRLFKRGVTLNKYHSASWVAWANFEQTSGNYDVARKLLITGISNFPNSKNIAWFHCSLAQLAAKQGDLNTARACYQRATETSPPQKAINIILEYARIESTIGSQKEARKLLDAAVKKYPGDERVQVMLKAMIGIE